MELETPYTQAAPLNGHIHISPCARAQAHTREDHSKDSEKDLEKTLVAEVKKRGGIAIKNTSQFHRGIPDRTVLLPYRTIAFVELKSGGKKPEPLQQLMLTKLSYLGFACFVIDSFEDLDEFLWKMDNRLARIEARMAQLGQDEV